MSFLSPNAKRAPPPPPPDPVKLNWGDNDYCIPDPIEA